MTSREALVDAARALLSKQGFEATSPAEIQRLSGIGQGSFYHHFESKADLASEALSELADDMCAEFDQLATGSPLEAITAYLLLTRNTLAGCRIGRMAMESSVSDDHIREPVGRYFDHLRTVLASLFAELDTDIDPAGLADLAVAAVQGAYVTARATNDASTMTRATAALIELITSTTTRSAQ